MEKKDIVRYENKLNQLNLKGVTTKGMDLFLCIISCLQGKRDKEISLTYTFLRKLANTSKGITNKQFTEEVTKLKNAMFNASLEIKEGNKIREIHLFSEFVIDPDKANITVILDERSIHLLNDLRQYTTLELKTFISLRSRYSKTLYRHLRQYNKTGVFRVSLEDFKFLFSIPEKTPTSNIYKFIIKQAVDDLKPYFKNLKCDVFRLSKQGAPVGAYIFSWTPPDQIPGQETLFENEYINKPKQAKKKKTSDIDYDKLAQEIIDIDNKRSKKE